MCGITIHPSCVTATWKGVLTHMYLPIQLLRLVMFGTMPWAPSSSEGAEVVSQLRRPLAKPSKDHECLRSSINVVACTPACTSCERKPICMFRPTWVCVFKHSCNFTTPVDWTHAHRWMRVSPPHQAGVQSCTRRHKQPRNIHIGGCVLYIHKLIHEWAKPCVVESVSI